MVMLPSQHSRCPRKIVTGCSTVMRFVLAILAMLTEIVRSTGVSVSLYAVAGSSTRAAADKTETRSIPKTTIVQRRYFTEKPQVTSDDMPIGLPCQRKRTQPWDRMRQRVSRSFHRRLGHQASRNTRRLLTMFKSRITAVRTKCRNQAFTLIGN